MDISQYSIEMLARNHDRDEFSCGVSELDEYLKKFARKHNTDGLNSTWVLVEKNSPRIIGFYSFAAATVIQDTFPDPVKSKLPNYDIPCFRLTRFGIDSRYQGQGLGAFLLFKALHHAKMVSEQIGAFAVVIDAKNDNVKKFYMYHGFKELSGLLLYLPTKELKKRF